MRFMISTPQSSTNASPLSAAKNQNAVVLLSGGLDSVTCLYWAKDRYAEVTAVSFNYGQRHNSELVAAKQIAEQAGVPHRIIDIDIAQLGGSSLTDHTMSVPDGNADKFPSHNDSIDNDAIPNTYVPARNTIFLSYALAVAEVADANHIVIGVSSVDYSGYPDCRPEYINAFEVMANLATKAGAAGLASFLYLEILDASFSLDGVIGAFALTKDIVLIAAGLTIGAIFVRSLTVMMVKKGTLEAYRFLEHGAHYGIGALAVIMLLSMNRDIHIPEVVTGLIGAGFIVLAVWASLVANRRESLN